MLGSSKFTKDDLINELISSTTNIEKLDKIYKNLDIDLNSLYAENEPILNACCKKDLLQAVIWLLEHNINTEIENDQKETAIFYSIYSKDTLILKTLVDFKANINHLNNKNRTALQESINSSNNRITRYLLQITKTLTNHDMNGNNILFDAVTNGNINLIKSIISLNKIDINEINNDGNTILHLENVLKNNELAMFLLESGANPTISNREGKSLLFHCAVNGIKNINIIKRASFFGFDLNLKNRDNHNILMEAVNYFLQIPKDEKKRRDNQAELIKELLQMDINIQTVDNENETIFFNITRSEDRGLIHYFLNNGLNINLNKQNNEGLTVLTLLILGGIENSDLIKLYLEKGASLDIKNKFGVTPLLFAILNDDEKMVKLLLELGASCDLADEKGRTIIHTCIFKDKTKYIKYIHKYNSQVINIEDNFGARPINYAAFMGKKDLVLEMLDMGALVENNTKKSPNILSFLEKYHKNILDITIDVNDEKSKEKLNLLAQNMIKEFGIKTLYKTVEINI